MEFGVKTAVVSFSLVAVAFGVAFGACSSDHPEGAVVGASQPDSSSGGPATNFLDASSDAASDGAISCTVPALGGGVVTATFPSGDVPADTGGTIAPGTYDLTAYEVYLDGANEGEPNPVDAGPAPTAQATFAITATTMDVWHRASQPDGMEPVIVMSNAKVRVDDVFIYIDETCPTTDSRQTPFSATGSQVILHTGQHTREIYTRRQ